MTETESDILKPGTKIRPQVTDDEVVRLCERLYGIVIKEMHELDSYDDRNFFIHVDRNVKNPLLSHNYEHGYVLKVLNSLDTNKTGYIDAQNKLMLHAADKEIKCSVPVKNVLGQYYSVELLGKYNHKHIVRLLQFIPGKILHAVPITDHLIYQTGVFVSRFDSAVKNFEHDAFRTHKTLWSLESIPNLKQFLYVMKDTAKLDIVEQVIEKYNKYVLSKSKTFEKGIIHGDFNEQNILLNEINSNSNEYRVSAIIDFGDISYGNYVYEIAIAMTYMMVESQKLESGGIFLAGYNQCRLVPENELKVLRLCIAARLCQSLVLGTYSHSLDPTNNYLLTTQSAGWKLLEELWPKSDEEIIQLWRETGDEYLKQSVK